MDTEQRHKIYVGGLDDTINKEDLAAEFSRFGKTSNVWVALNPVGFGFVEYDTEEEAQSAVQMMNGAEFRGCTLRVEVSRYRGGRSRGGGGFRGGRGGGGFRGGRGGGGGYRSDDGYGGGGFRGRGRGGGGGGYGDGGGRGRGGFGGSRGRDQDGDFNGDGSHDRYRSRSPRRGDDGGRGGGFRGGRGRGFGGGRGGGRRPPRDQY